MNARRSHFMSLILASMLTMLFTIAATIIIVAWSPIVPEAIAVDLNSDDADDENFAANKAKDFAQYIALHETETWPYRLLRAPVLSADCSP